MADAFDSSWELVKARISYPRTPTRFGFPAPSTLTTSNWETSTRDPSEEELESRIGTSDYLDDWGEEAPHRGALGQTTSAGPLRRLKETGIATNERGDNYAPLKWRGPYSARNHPEKVLAQILGMENIDDLDRDLTEDEDISWGGRMNEIATHEAIHQALSSSGISQEERLDDYQEEYAATLGEIDPIMDSSGKRDRKLEQDQHLARMGINAAVDDRRLMPNPNPLARAQWHPALARYHQMMDNKRKLRKSFSIISKRQQKTCPYCDGNLNLARGEWNDKYCTTCEKWVKPYGKPQW